MSRKISRSTRFGVVVAVGAMFALTACGSGSGGSGNSGPAASNIKSTTNGEYGTLPPASGTAHKGGTFTYGISAGTQPNFIFPITPGNFASIYNQQFYDQMYMPLIGVEVSDRPLVDYNNGLANTPVYSDGNKTVTLNLKTNWKWSNGATVDANDVLFDVDIIKAAVKESPSNFSNYSPGDFPDNIASMSAPSPSQVVFHLTKAYNPTYFTENELGLITPLPSTFMANASAGGATLDYTDPANAKKIYDYLLSQAKDVKSYDSNPLWQDVDGPYHLTAFNPTTDANTLTPNPKYTGPQPAYATAKAVYFASSTAETNALRSGTLDIGGVPHTDLAQVPALRGLGYHVWGYPDLGFSDLVWNFQDATNDWDHIIGQQYVRAALAHLQNETAIIQGVFKGAAAVAYGPVPAIPHTAFVPPSAANTPFGYSIAAAKQLLSSHGWKVVPNGTTTCQSPGTGSNQCGAGIKKGDNLDITIPYTSDPATIQQQLAALSSSAKQVGVNITPVGRTFNFIIQNYDDQAAPSNKDKWQAEDYGGIGGGIYPTTNEIFNTGGSLNSGGYSDKKADSLINASKFSSDPNAVRNEAQYVTVQQPALFEPNPDLISAWKGVSGDPDAFASLSQYGLPLNYFYVTS